jgi:hypothetical protein
MGKQLFLFFAGLAGIGLLVCVAVHIASMLGAGGLLVDSTNLIFLGLLVVWPPTIAGIYTLSKNARGQYSIGAIFQSCPKWLRLMTYIFFGYAFLNAFLPGGARTPAEGVPLGILSPGGMSGYFMALYAAALAILYSAANTDSGKGKPQSS